MPWRILRKCLASVPAGGGLAIKINAELRGTCFRLHCQADGDTLLVKANTSDATVWGSDVSEARRRPTIAAKVSHQMIGLPTVGVISVSSPSPALRPPVHRLMDDPITCEHCSRAECANKDQHAADLATLYVRTKSQNNDRDNCTKCSVGILAQRNADLVEPAALTALKLLDPVCSALLGCWLLGCLRTIMAAT